MVKDLRFFGPLLNSLALALAGICILTGCDMNKRGLEEDITSLMSKVGLPKGVVRCYMSDRSREGVAQMTLSASQWQKLLTRLQLEDITATLSGNSDGSVAAPATTRTPTTEQWKKIIAGEAPDGVIEGRSATAPTRLPGPRNPRDDRSAINRMNSLWSHLVSGGPSAFPNVGRLRVYKKSTVPLQSERRFDQFYVFYDPVTGNGIIYVSYAYG